MIPEKKILLEKWLLVADHDLEVARYIIEGNPLVLDAACFHCQQAIEKNLRAFLVFCNYNFPKTHDLSKLKKACLSFDKDFDKIDIKDLEDFAVHVRYPGDSIDPSIEIAEEYIKIVNQTRRLVLKKIALKK